MCGASGASRSGSDGTWVGQSFHLVFAPSIRADTFLHLNRQGDHWKLRHYPSRTQRPVVIAQSGPASGGPALNLAMVGFKHERFYPHSSGSDGVRVNNSAFWFDEIAKANAEYLPEPGGDDVEQS